MSSFTERLVSAWRLRRARRGSQAVEFALLLPVLMAVMSGVVDYGWYYSQQLATISAVREGGRAAAVTDPETATYCTAAVTRVRTALTSGGLDGAGATVTAATSGTVPDQLITVSASVSFGKLMGLVPTPKLLKSTVTMRLENQDDTAACSK